MNAVPGTEVETLYDLLIPMRDGVRLAANLYRPAGGGRVPCLVNYLPYHKDGRGGLWYEGIHHYFARRGFATLVADFRGLGCSEGVNNTPFDAQEGRDGHDLVEWAAGQPWCDGAVGMWGISYGGITALKAAAERPPHLKAIVPVHATWDNYSDFLLLGGCRNGFWANGDWGPRMIAYNLAPPLAPDPDGRLARLWQERLEHSTPWCLDWYDSPDEVARWAARAIPAERITAATFAVCGWQDFYPQGTLDYFARLAGPKKLLLGPWKHIMPDLSPVEPVGLLELMVRWWERWLRGRENGADAGPPLTVLVQGAGWRHEEAWPPARNEERELYLQPGGALLAARPAGSSAGTTYRHDPTVGLDSLPWDPWTVAVAEQGDQSSDDARSLCFTTEPLADDWELVGQARVAFTVAPSAPGLQYTARLADVSPGGGSRLVTLGWSPDPGGKAGGPRRVAVALRPTAYRFRRRQRVRLALALADFPRLWPTPHPGEIRLEYPANDPPRLWLPRTPPGPARATAELPLAAEGVRTTHELEAAQSWRVCRELAQPAAALESASLGSFGLRGGGTVTYRHEYGASVAAANPAGAAIECRSSVEVRRPTGIVVVNTQSRFTRDAASMEADIERDGAVIFHKRWQQERGDTATPG